MKALVTGGSRGIGKTIALELANLGYDVAVAGRSTEELSAVVSEIEKVGVKGFAITADLAEALTAKYVIDTMIEHFKSIDVLVNCAGLSASGSFTDVTVEDWDRIFAVNARAPFFICQAAFPFLKKSERPIVINIASVVGFKGYINQSVYSSSKHALTGFTKVFAKEAQPFGIRVHLISPGGVATEMVTKMRPDINAEELIQPYEIAELVRYFVTCKGNGIVDHIYIRRYSGLAFD